MKLDFTLLIPIRIWESPTHRIHKASHGVYEVWQPDRFGWRITHQISIKENWIAAYNIALDVCEGREHA